MNIDNFKRARASVIGEAEVTEGVGGLNERSLHKILKLTIEPRAEYHEVKYLGSVADVKNEEGIFEIQTKSAYKLRPKLLRFLSESRVDLVIPIISEKYIRYIDEETGERAPPRRSPKAENIYTALNSMCTLADLFYNDNFKVTLVYLSADEYKRKKKRRGERKIDVMPKDILSVEELSSPDDLIRYFPEGISGEFLAKDFAGKIKRPSRFSYYVLKFFENLGYVSAVGMCGRAIVYKTKGCFI